MAGPSRIDELRKKFDENPRRYFAPLANEYRKSGDFEQAIFICQEFLPQQPGHMSGHIVYGQALFETGRHDEARSVFETALALDPENLIALRHLGDIARARGDNETARDWYRRVLESDPRNEEIVGILTSLDTDGGTAPPAAAPQQENAAGESEGGSLQVESAISSASPGTAAPSPSAAPAGPSESNFDDLAKLFTASSPSGLASGPLQLIHEGEDLLGHPDEHTSADAQPIRGAASSSGAPPFARDEENAPSGFHASFLDGLTNEAPPAEPAPAPKQAAPQAPPPPQQQPASAPAAPPSDASSAFVTETMAELYVKQGHLDEALEVYRRLLKLHPDDANLAARASALEQDRDGRLRGVPAVPSPAPEVVADAGPTIREFLGQIAESRPRGSRSPDDFAPAIPNSVPEARSAAPAATVGGSIHNLFTDAEQRPRADQVGQTNHDATAASASHDRAAAEPSLGGRPATPAATELSLDHVFRHATPATGSGAQAGFSFDQFFSQQAQQDVTASDAEPSSEAGAGQPDDIQQFNAWLEGLKKT
ncbi:MAG TPA: tetratricopeptide repeat protein [Gemmatimonadaceae bacterium]|jgi:tetratricopeptide (TPR) repeat protein